MLAMNQQGKFCYLYVRKRKLGREIDLSKAIEQEGDIDKIPTEGWFQSLRPLHCITQPQNIPTSRRQKNERQTLNHKAVQHQCQSAV